MLQFLRNKRSSIFLLFILVLVCLPVIIPFSKPGFFETDDGNWMIIRFSAFHQALRDGQFPVRWLGRLNFEYGYPVADFLYPGFLYFAEVFKLLGFNFINSIKAVLIVSILGSGIFAYLYLSKIFNKVSGFIGALLYVYAPYHLFDIYKRGSVGENLALGLLPLCLLFLEYDMFFFFTLSVSFLLISHNTLAILFFPILLGYVFIKFKTDRMRLKKYSVALLLSVSISLFFWGPALYDLQFTIFSQTSVSDWSSYFASYNLIGFSCFVVLITTLYLLLKGSNKKVSNNLAVYFLVLLSMSMFLSVVLSTFVWKFLPVSFVQFPFRFLSIVVFSTSFLGAFALYSSNNFWKKILFTLLVISTIPALSFIKTKDTTYEDSFYSTNEATTTVRNEYMPKWVQVLPVKRPEQKVELLDGKNIINLQKNTTKTTIFTTNGSKSFIRIHTIYFPGWNAYIDNKPVDIVYTNKRGLIELFVPEGQHAIKVKFGETNVRLVSDIISVLGFVVLIALSTTFKKQQA